jgi:hypothetical protein
MKTQDSVLPEFIEIFYKCRKNIPIVTECIASDIERKGYSRYRFPEDATTEMLAIGERLWSFFDVNDVRFAGQVISMLMELGRDCLLALGLERSFDVHSYLYLPNPLASFSGLIPRHLKTDPYESYFSERGLVWQPIDFCLFQKLCNGERKYWPKNVRSRGFSYGQFATCSVWDGGQFWIIEAVN